MTKHFIAAVIFLFSISAVHATHVIGGFISIVRVEGKTVTFRFTGFREKGSPILYDSGVFSFGDGSQLEGDFEVSKVPVSENLELAIFEIKHTYTGAGEYTVGFKESHRNTGIQNVSTTSNTPFYVDLKFLLDPLLPNQYPLFDVHHLLDGLEGTNYEQAIKVREEDGDLVVFSLVTPKSSASNYLSDHSLKGMTIDRFTGNLNWSVPGYIPSVSHHNEYLYAVRASEYRLVDETWILLSSTTIDFNIEIDHHSDLVLPTLEWTPGNCDESGSYSLEMNVSGTESTLFVDASFLELENAESANSMSGTVLYGDSTVQLSLIPSDLVMRYGFAQLVTDGYSTSRNVLYTLECKYLEDIAELVTGDPQKLEEIKLFPNPSTGLFKVTRSNARFMKIISIECKTVFTQVLASPDVSVNLKSQLDGGMYFVHFFDQMGLLIGSRRLVIVP
ncbi:MAG: hypothetical protein RIC35_25010 [Marinoscillum sp.]